jgi:ribose transport system substrate-binding protein
VTNWDPALTQKVLSAAIAKYPKIDVIVSDFGPSLVGALPEFTRAAGRSRRSRPRTATCSGASGRRTTLATRRSSCSPSRRRTTTHGLAIDWAVALATGGRSRRRRTSPSLVFENSTTGRPNPVECKASLPGDIYLSAELPAAAQAKLVKK